MRCPSPELNFFILRIIDLDGSYTAWDAFQSSQLSAEN